MKYQSVYELNKVQQYVMQMRPILRKQALFSDGTSDYRRPAEPKENDQVTIRFRTAKNNVDVVWLCIGEEKIQMSLEETDDTFDYYQTTYQLGSKPVYYYFEIVSGLLHCYYDRYGVTRERRNQYDFCIVPGFYVPDWAKGAVMYQIMVDRFYNGDYSNDVLSDEYHYIRTNSVGVPKEQWGKIPENFSVCEFYGGDLEGILKKLDYLQSLGVEVLYLNPIFVSPSNHKYDIQDYDHIDPHFAQIVVDEGELLQPNEYDNRKATRYQNRVTNQANLEASNDFFAHFCQEVHRRGMRIILDGVFNHCGSFNCWLDKEKIYTDKDGFQEGAYLSKESPYHTYFKFQEEDARNWPDNRTYEGWWGHDTLPKLNYEDSAILYQDILRIAKKWVSEPYCVDGWRLDVAADLGHSEEFNHQFWRDFRETVRTANPEAIILAEHYGDPKAWLLGDQWDTIMNYSAFMEPLTWFLTGMEKHSDEYCPERIGKIDEFEGAMRHYMTSFMTSSLYSAMNQLSNHDHSRFLTRTNHIVGRAEFVGAKKASEDIDYRVMREAVLVQMTWPGAPTLYYGDEAGVCGFTDPDNRRTYPWGYENTELIDFYREMIFLHKNNEALKTGSFQFLNGEEQLLCYSRFNRRQQFIILVNNADEEKEIEVSVLGAGMPFMGEVHQRIVTTELGYSLMPMSYPIEYGKVKLVIKEKTAMILEHE